MRYIFVDESWEDYLYWQENDPKMLARLNQLLKDISRNPFKGLGKPEPLKFKYQGFRSRRTRLYRRYLTIFLEQIETEFDLLGELNGKTERFQKGIDYQFFLISKKGI